MYLCFFPVTVAMVQGLRSPQRIETELLHTYAATEGAGVLDAARCRRRCRSCSRRCESAIAAGLVGAMVAELPTGAQAGLGARLLTGSYYGNTVGIWSALRDVGAARARADRLRRARRTPADAGRRR